LIHFYKRKLKYAFAFVDKAAKTKQNVVAFNC